MNSKQQVCIWWLRRDLRLSDNAALFHALASGVRVLPVFLFDRKILDIFEKPYNAQVEFIHNTLSDLDIELHTYGSALFVKYGFIEDFFEDITKHFEVKAVYVNDDYELSARQRDEQVETMLGARGIPFHRFKDHVVFHKDDILKDDATPYTVFTPYSRKWKQHVSDIALKPYDCDSLQDGLLPYAADREMPSLAEMGFATTKALFPPKEIDINILASYTAHRDYPAMNGTSHLGVHLRFGTISIRSLVSLARLHSEVFLNELIWREFYQMITWHFPHVCSSQSFKKNYDAIVWKNNEQYFAAWCEGMTGYPLVDAGMRQLNQTGYMHNRVRMITASFLVKHLLVDWRWGEAYFANRLLDFDFAANNGGWQWVAGCGCDAAPYFRIFNPKLQAAKFDKQNEYIHRWVPELTNGDYCPPIVDHDTSRIGALDLYRSSLVD